MHIETEIRNESYKNFFNYETFNGSTDGPLSTSNKHIILILIRLSFKTSYFENLMWFIYTNTPRFPAQLIPRDQEPNKLLKLSAFIAH